MDASLQIVKKTTFCLKRTYITRKQDCIAIFKGSHNTDKSGMNVVIDLKLFFFVLFLMANLLSSTRGKNTLIPEQMLYYYLIKQVSPV